MLGGLVPMAWPNSSRSRSRTEAVLDPAVVAYMDDVPLEGPKVKMVKKWSGNGLGPSQMTCPKSCQRVPKKLSKNGLSKIWGQKTALKVVNKWSKNNLLANRRQKGGRRPKAAAPLFGWRPKAATSICQTFLTTFLQLFGQFFVPRSC